MTTKPVVRPPWSLFDDSDKGSEMADFVNNTRDKIDAVKRAKTDCRNNLVRIMATEMGLSAYQIARTYLCDESGRSFVVPGLTSAPRDLAEVAREYLETDRGFDPGFLIKRRMVRGDVNPNSPIKTADMEKIINGYYEEKRASDARRRSEADPSVDVAVQNEVQQQGEEEELLRGMVEEALMDSFASSALTGLIAVADRDDFARTDWAETFAATAYKAALAMIAERRRIPVH